MTEKGIRVADEKIDDLLTYALFPQVGIKFLENRDNPDFFEPVPQAPISSSTSEEDEGIYTVSFQGKSYTVNVSAGGTITSMGGSSDQPALSSQDSQVNSSPVANEKEDVSAPLSGTIWKILVSPNQNVKKGDTLLVLEAMKMETTIKTPVPGKVLKIFVKNGDKVSAGDPLFEVAE